MEVSLISEIISSVIFPITLVLGFVDVDVVVITVEMLFLCCFVGEILLNFVLRLER
jgi:hypothetical protein